MLDLGSRGLTCAEAAERFARDGPNALPLCGSGSNPPLVVALFWEPLANLLGRSPPPLGSWVVAVSVVPPGLAEALSTRVRRARGDRWDPGAIDRWPT